MKNMTVGRLVEVLKTHDQELPIKIDTQCIEGKDPVFIEDVTTPDDSRVAAILDENEVALCVTIMP